MMADHGKGFSDRSLRQMLHFAEALPNEQYEEKEN